MELCWKQDQNQAQATRIVYEMTQHKISFV
jgi:hypothetical protein